MKRIVVDARMVKAEGHGISNYVLHIAEALGKIPKSYELFYLVDKALPQDHPLRREKHKNSSIRFLHPLEPWKLGAEIAALKPSLYHSPSFASLWSYTCPHIQTVHDLNHLHYGNFAQRLYYAWLLLPSLRTAKKIISVSDSSRDELSEWLRSQGLEKKIELAENAITSPAAQTDPKLLSRWDLSAGNYFFALSNNKPFKNLAMLKKAYASARARKNIAPLVISTSGQSADGIIHTGPLTDSEVATLLPNAAEVYFPSLYEGFGRPPLEAALAGVVPVVSDIRVHREVLNGVSEAIFLDPLQSSLWEEQFLSPHRRKVSENSQAWIRKQYPLEKLAKAMHGIYEAALKESK
ncbi:MAG: glycosyltransferase family 4 protein [Bdellovibrionota bacterium]